MSTCEYCRGPIPEQATICPTCHSKMYKGLKLHEILVLFIGCGGASAIVTSIMLVSLPRHFTLTDYILVSTLITVIATACIGFIYRKNEYWLRAGFFGDWLYLFLKIYLGILLISIILSMGTSIITVDQISKLFSVNPLPAQHIYLDMNQ